MEHDLSVRSLARRGALDVRTVERIEEGGLRPRPSLLWSIAWGLDPDEVDALYGHLVAAAVPEVPPDTLASLRARRRHMDAGWRAGDVPVPTALERAARLAAASWAMMSARHALADLLAEPLTVAEFEALSDLLTALGGEEEALAVEAGNFAQGVPLRRHRRGDPPDVPVTPPEGAGLAAIGRWAREWQVREGRQPPRTARENAIAATGAAERAKARRYPMGEWIRLRWTPDQCGQRKQPRVIREDEAEPMCEGGPRVRVVDLTGPGAPE
ncbi:MAG: hypothetical protein ACRDNZ_20580 [Streptosporangiaceae bacterium]